ncbi:MAG: glycosyltransferase family 4 protein [Polyangiaceae bacterium]|nr:glycosyltransferase family 4 protein [Polyangiaceae bacterium]
MATKVCFDISTLSSGSRHRGIGMYALTLAKAFAKIQPRPADLEIYLALGRGLALRVVPLPDDPAWIEAEALRGKPVPYTVYYATKQTVALARLMAEGVDLVHAAEPKGACFPPRCRTIVTCHDIIPAVLGPPYRSRFTPAWVSAAVATARYRLPDHVIAISAYTRSDLERVTGISRDRVSVVHHGVDASVFHLDKGPHEAARIRAIAGERPYFLYVGGFDERKQVPELIAAFARAARDLDHALVIAGRIGRNERAPIERAVAAAGAKERVVLAGFVSAEDLPALYRGATAHVMPSTYEGFGMTVLEAFACGCPVIAARTSSVPEIAGDAALFVPPGDTDALSEAIGRVALEESLRRSLTERGLARAAQFTWERCAAETLDVYRSVLGR